MSGDTPYTLDDDDEDLDYLDYIDDDLDDADTLDEDEDNSDTLDDLDNDFDTYDNDPDNWDDEDDEDDEWDDEDDEWDDEDHDLTDYDELDYLNLDDLDLDDEDDEYDEDDDDENDDTSDEDEDNTSPDADEKDAIIKSLRKENAARRKKLQELREQSMGAVEEAIAETMTQLAQQIGIDTNDTDNILTELTEKIRTAEKDRLAARRDLAIYKAAAPLKVDIARLADSKKFTQTIDELDPTDDNYATDVAHAVKAAVEANPHYRTSGQLDRSGGDFTGGNTQPVESGVEARRAQRQKRRGITISNPKG